MRPIPRSYRRLALLILALPLTLLVMGLLYQAGMTYLEGQPRSLGESIEWAAETLTTTGYGRDARWTHPAMQVFVVLAQFGGVLIVFLVFPVFLIPFFEERFQARIPTRLPELRGQVLIYRYGPAVTSLLHELDSAGVGVVIFEEEEATARRLHERGRRVVLGDLEEEDPDLTSLLGARGLVANGPDDENAAMILSARHHGFDGPIVALVEDPNRRPPMVQAGATAAFTPDHLLAAALASRASTRISPRVSGVRQLGHHLEVEEHRVHAASPLAGRTIAESEIRSRTGATIVGLWVGGEMVAQPSLDRRLDVGTILVSVGSREALDALGALATPVPRAGPILVIGTGGTRRRVATFLRDAEEEVRVLDADPAGGADLPGDPFDPDLLRRAGLGEAQAVVIAHDTDSATLFAAAVVRGVAPDAVILAGANRVENVARIHRAGADFALSVGQVAGQMLAYHLLGRESVSLEAGLKLVATAAGHLAGRTLQDAAIRERTGCTVVAVERGDDVLVRLGPEFRLEDGDLLHLIGTKETIASYFRAFPQPKAPRPSDHGSPPSRPRDDLAGAQSHQK